MKDELLKVLNIKLKYLIDSKILLFKSAWLLNTIGNT